MSGPYFSKDLKLRESDVYAGSCTRPSPLGCGIIRYDVYITEDEKKWYAIRQGGSQGSPLRTMNIRIGDQYPYGSYKKAFVDLVLPLVKAYTDDPSVSPNARTA